MYKKQARNQGFFRAGDFLELGHFFNNLPTAQEIKASQEKKSLVF